MSAQGAHGQTHAPQGFPPPSHTLLGVKEDVVERNPESDLFVCLCSGDGLGSV